MGAFQATLLERHLEIPEPLEYFLQSGMNSAFLIEIKGKVEMHTGTATLENSMEGPQKFKIELPYDPVIPLLGIHLKEITLT